MKLVLPDSILRPMNRQQYKAVMRWLRLSRGRIEQFTETKADSLELCGDVISIRFKTILPGYASHLYIKNPVETLER